MNAMTSIETMALNMVNDIDHLSMLDRQLKALQDDVKKAKEDIANKYGEGKHRGVMYGVSVLLVPVSGTVDYKKLCEEYGISDETLNTFRKKGRADIRVTSTV